MASPIHLSNLQRQQLGNLVKEAGFKISDFDLKEHKADEGFPRGYYEFNYKNSPYGATIYLTNSSDNFHLALSPGTDFQSMENIQTSAWNVAMSYLDTWLTRLKHEIEAKDPWAEEDEDVFNDSDDGKEKFNLDEIPKVDAAIDAAMNRLVEIAKSNGRQINKSDLKAIRENTDFLKTTARKATKNEWRNIFAGVVIGKLLDWGLDTQLLNDVVQTLISSAHTVLQITETSFKYLS